MLALLGLALSQCESGRLVKEVPVARYAPWCCAGESHVWFDDLTSAQIQEMKGKYVTVVPQTVTSLQFPISASLIAKDTTLQ